MRTNELKTYIIDKLKAGGAEQASISFTSSEKTELNSASGEMTLLRTNVNESVNITAIKDFKKGGISLNKRDKESIDKAIEEVLQLMQVSKPDKALDIAEYHEKQSRQHLPLEADLDKMYFRMKEFLMEAKKRYPKTILEEVILDFTKRSTLQVNSNGVENYTEKGFYTVVIMFTTKDGKKTSSFNYISNSRKDLDRPILEFDSIDRLLAQSAEQTSSKSIDGKFVGSVIATPECLGNFVGQITNYISAYPLITKTSLYQDKLNKKIASNNFTLRSMPLHKDMIGYDFTNELFIAENLDLVENGILKNFIVGLYASNKTGFKKVNNNGGFLVVDKGEKSLEEMIKSTKKGILLCRFSGGEPSNNGDFSGVAKNSYYIENGEIQYPISETMISGNIADMFNDITDISAERINSGFSIYPWIKFEGLTISGK